VAKASDRRRAVAFTVTNYPRSESGAHLKNRAIVRVPVIIDKPATPVVKDSKGNRVRASLINIHIFYDPKYKYSAEVVFVASFEGVASESYTLELEKRSLPKMSPIPTWSYKCRLKVLIP